MKVAMLSDTKFNNAPFALHVANRFRDLVGDEFISYVVNAEENSPSMIEIANFMVEAKPDWVIVIPGDYTDDFCTAALRVGASIFTVEYHPERDYTKPE
jgi:hypothetical protein